MEYHNKYADYWLILKWIKKCMCSLYRVQSSLLMEALTIRTRIGLATGGMTRLSQWTNNIYTATRIGPATGGMTRLSQWTNNIYTATKIKLFKSLVLVILSEHCESRNLNADIFVAIRRILKISNTEYERNEYVWQNIITWQALNSQSCKQ